MLGIFGIDADGGAVHGLAAGARDVLGPVLIGKQRAGLGHAVAHEVRELDLPEDLLDLGIEGGAAHDELLHVAAEGLHEAVLDLLVDDLVDAGDLEEELHEGLVDGRLDLGLVDLLHHERHGDQQVRLDVGECLEERGRGRGLAEPVDGRAVAERVDELDYEAVHMGHREHRDHLARRDVALAEVDVGAEVPVGQHDALRVAGGAGSVVDRGQVVPVVGREDHIVRAVAGRPLGRERGVDPGVGLRDLVGSGVEQLPGVDVDDELDSRHLVDVQLLELILVGEEGDALGVIHQEGGPVGGEVGQQRHDHGFVGVHGEVGHTPGGAVAGPEGDLLTLLDAEFLEEKMEFLNLGGHLAISEGLTADAVEGGLVPVLARCILQTLQIVRIISHVVVLLFNFHVVPQM